VAERIGFAPASRPELLGWTGPDAGPPAPAVTTDPTGDPAGRLSSAAASTLAGRLLGPGATMATWTLTCPTTATALVDGHSYVVVDKSDPYGWFTSLQLYQVMPCDSCGGEHQFPIDPTGRLATACGKPRRSRLELAAKAGQPGRSDRPTAASRTRKEAGRTCLP
jgi:hypothetical protein